MNFRVDAEVEANSLSPALLVGGPEAGEDRVVGVAGVVDLRDIDQVTGQRVNLKDKFPLTLQGRMNTFFCFKRDIVSD